MNSPKILIVGGAGYIGGSLIANLLSGTNGPLEDVTIYASVRSEGQVQALAKAGINAIELDVSNEVVVRNAILRHEIDIAINATVGFDPNIASYIIKALGERHKVSGRQTYFIQSSVLAVFSIEGGWTYGEVRDSDSTLEKDKKIGGPNPVRVTDIAIATHSQALGVKSFIMALPHVYGTGSGQGRKLSVNIPAFVRTSLVDKVVYKFDRDAYAPSVHIDDLTSLYRLVIEHIIKDQPAPGAEDEYHFVMAHRSSWWAVMDRIAKALYARGLISELEVQFWPSDEEAAKKLGYPLSILDAAQKSDGEVVPVNPYKLGWNPQWNEERYLQSIDDEVQAALDLDTVKPSLFKSLT